ncbi:MAG: DUF554 family protein [Oscillospiraceae bacterium]|nr:DUF554 family protein [Oscillospiraceae bacterium]
MLGVIVNTFTVLLGSTLGLIFRKGIPERVEKAVMVALGLSTLYIGVDGALQGETAGLPAWRCFRHAPSVPAAAGFPSGHHRSC